MKPTVYIETTIPSYYCEDRNDFFHEIARTRQWWDHERNWYECFTSQVVLDELSAGAYAGQQKCLTLAESLPLVAVVDEVLDIAEVYQTQKLMPRHPAADSIHVALASFYRMDYLLTWNCRHLANVNKARHLEIVNARMGLSAPLLITPHQLQPLEDWQ